MQIIPIEDCKGQSDVQLQESSKIFIPYVQPYCSTINRERAGIMLFAVITVLLAASTQTDALFTVTMPPPSVPTFEVITEGQSPFFAGMKISGTWVTDYSLEIKPTQNVEFVLDNPFYTATSLSMPMRRAQIKYEPPAMRRARLETIWMQNGYTFLETSSGWRAVKKEDIELAARARNMATVQKAPVSVTFDIPSPEHASPAAGTSNARMLFMLRAAIIIAGGIIAGVALKIIFRKQAGWKALE
jgi:hypothetical protein